MDPNAVLRKFVELCNNRQSGHISQNFASNGVIDWYGRTLKGPRRIADFFRFNDHYQHNFTDGKHCSPIETRDTHTATRQIPPENLTERTEEQAARTDSQPTDNVPSTSGESSKAGFMTPPQQNAPLPTVPPPLTQGRIFRKMSSSDDDDDDDGVCSIRKFKEDLEEASKSGDLIPMEPSIEAGESALSLSRKRPANDEETEMKIPTKRFKDVDCDSGVAEGAEAEQLTDLYTELKYIEAFGTLEMLRRTKHRGVQTTPSTSHDSVSSHYEERSAAPPGNEHKETQWVRETKLSISYRLHRFHTNEVQFALVIYDYLTKRPTTRRNLISDFGSIVIDRTQKSTPPRKKTADKAKTALTPRKPLRF